MDRNEITVERWSEPEPPTEAVLRRIMNSEDLEPYRWSNGPDYEYSTHSHPYRKVIYCVDGSITFGLPAHDEKIELQPGDRLELPPGVSHDAVVGPDGVVCLEAHVQ